MLSCMCIGLFQRNPTSDTLSLHTYIADTNNAVEGIPRYCSLLVLYINKHSQNSVDRECKAAGMGKLAVWGSDEGGQLHTCLAIRSGNRHFSVDSDFEEEQD